MNICKYNVILTKDTDILYYAIPVIINAHIIWGEYKTMKKYLLVTVVVFLTVIMMAPSIYAESRGTALIVHGTTDGILEGDQTVADNLTAYGFDVDFILAADCDENTWKGYDIIFIGESVISTDIGTKFTAADCIVIVSEPGNYDEMLLGNYDTQYDTANIYSKGKYNVVNDIISCGLTSFEGFDSEDVVPGFLLEWGEGGVVIVENDNGSPAVTLFAPGSKLFDGSSAVNYRIQWFFRRQDAAVASSDAWKVFESVINYVMPIAVVKDTAVVTNPVTNDQTASSPIAAQTADMSIVAWLFAAIATSAGIFAVKKRKKNL